MNGFVTVGAGRKKQAELDELPRDRAGLLQQLALRGRLRVFGLAVELPCRDLDQDLPHGITELPLEKDASVVQQRNNAHRTHMAHILARSVRAVRKAHGVFKNVHDVPVKNLAAFYLRFD